MTPVVVWSGGELLPPRPEQTQPVYNLCYTFEPHRIPEHGQRPSHSDYVRTRRPYKTRPKVTVTCAVCGQSVIRPAFMVRRAQKLGQRIVCSLPRKCRYALISAGKQSARLLPMAQPGQRGNA